MKRYWMIAVLVVVVLALGVTGVVLAQNPNPGTTPQPGRGYGMMGQGGMMGRGGTTGRGMMSGTDYQSTGMGQMHEYMQAALAEKLGISVDDLNAAYADGKTFWQVAEDKGLTTEQAQQIMLDARTAALDKMVADGTITQEQAGWMKNRSTGMMGGANGRGMMGRGAGSAGCPMWDGDEK
jgi:hypothetical protein